MLALARFGATAARRHLRRRGRRGGGRPVRRAALGRRAAGPLRRCRRPAGRGRPQRGRRLLDDRRRPADLRHPGRREGDHLDPHAGHRHARPRLDAAPDNAAIKLAEAVTRLAAARQPARLTPVVEAFLEGARPGRGAAAGRGRRRRGASPPPSRRRSSDPMLRRSLDAMLRDTVTPTVIQVGKKMNVIPGQRRGGDRRAHAARHRPGGPAAPPAGHRRRRGAGRVGDDHAAGRVPRRRADRAT